MSITLSEAVERFLMSYDNQNTVRGYRKTLMKFIEEYGGKRRVDHFTEEDIDIWNQDARLGVDGKIVSEATLMNRRRTIRAFWRWCETREYVEKNPARFLKIRRPMSSTTSKAIPTDVLRDMIVAAENKRAYFNRARDTAILSLLIVHALRRSDLASIRISKLNLAEGWYVPRIKRGKQPVELLTPDTTRLLIRWMEIRRKLDPDPDHDFVFVTNRTSPGQRYNPLSAEGVSSVVKSLSVEVCGKHYGTHSIRHWRGQFLADQRVPPTIVQEVLNHDDVQTTLAHYYNQDRERVRNVLNVYDLTTSLGLSEEPKPETKLESEPKTFRDDIITTDPAFWRKTRE